MDAQYPFASREDIWRVHEEVKDLYATQLEHGERISRLERRREDDARLKSVWGPLSPFPSAVSSAVPQDPTFTPSVEPFKGFDQGHHHTMPNNMTLDNDDEPRRGASRANSVRFDESSMYYGQNRSSSELPIRTGSGLGSHPLTERSLSHRSDGRQSSSGQSHHSARTNSLGLDTARAGSVGNGTLPTTPLPPPPGLFILGPVPCIIRCWLTTNFSNDSLLYAAVCSGSYASIISSRMVQKLGLSAEITDHVRSIKMPVYLPEASVYQSSSRAGSPTPHLPALTVRFIVRETDPNDKAVQIFIGSDVLRTHNADLLFSQDKMLLVDDERNKISIPLVRPEDDSTFRTLVTIPEPSRSDLGEIGVERETRQQETNGQQPAEQVSRQAISSPEKPASVPLSLRTSTDSLRSHDKPRSGAHTEDSEENAADHPPPKSSASEKSFGAPSRTENSSVWGPWRRDSNKAEPGSYMSAYQKSTRARSMKVLKPTKPLSSSRQVSNATAPSSAVEPSGPFRAGDSDLATARDNEPPHSATVHSAGARPGDGPWKGKARSSNPVGGASAFGWLNSNP